MGHHFGQKFDLYFYRRSKICPDFSKISWIFSRNLTNLPNLCKFNINFANISQNLGKFLIADKNMGQIFGQNLVNVWVSFHFPSGSSLPKNTWVRPPPRVFEPMVRLCWDMYITIVHERQKVIDILKPQTSSRKYVRRCFTFPLYS